MLLQGNCRYNSLKVAEANSHDSGRLYNTVMELYICNYANTKSPYLKADCVKMDLDGERLEFIQHEPPACLCVLSYH